MNCQYGCTTENIHQLCTCGHPKRWHLSIHPHVCKGEHDKEGVHVTKSCDCCKFTPALDEDPYVKNKDS